ncbi:hypothetical protein A0H76_43 [Hepatospora eriocheir]|uniref:NOB1 n=1 Tax=Hepatospora eriocheir TaxID=1081669 RepID=A0A1X0QJB1_9MICR|nr:hypothetical protein A0H76_43 [Hepatospora eriocheir]
MVVKAVIDTGYFIHQKLNLDEIDEGYITDGVYEEIKDNFAREFFEFMAIKIKLRNPQTDSINEVKNIISERHLNLSDSDIGVVAFTIELMEEDSMKWITKENIDKINKVLCLTTDNGVKAALKLIDLYEDKDFGSKKFKLRCYTCYTVFDKDIKICSECGYETITRVTVIEKEGKELICLKKGYIPKRK